MPEAGLLARAARLVDLYRARGWRVAAAESCTGGLIIATLTEIAGSSDVVDRGFITYSNEAKTELLGVPAAMIAAHGAVSREVAGAMAAGAMATARADVVVSVTGIAGPGGGGAEKPVGLVWFGCAVRSRGSCTAAFIFPGDRGAIRIAAVSAAFDLFEAAANQAASQ